MAEPPKKDGDLFESVGKKVESISLGHDSTLKDTKAATNTSTEAEENEPDDVRVVDEIESLCMNCEENVLFSYQYTTSDLTIVRVQHAFS